MNRYEAFGELNGSECTRIRTSLCCVDFVGPRAARTLVGLRPLRHDGLSFPRVLKIDVDW